MESTIRCRARPGRARAASSSARPPRRPCPAARGRASRARREALEARLRQEGHAALVAELALADVRVAVAVGAERRLRVVQVQRAEPVEADDGVGALERVLQARHRADVVAGREQVAGVEAEPEPPLAAAGLDQRGQLLERAPERAAGAGRVLEVQRAAPRSPRAPRGRPRRRARSPRRRRPSSPSRGAARRRSRRSPAPTRSEWVSEASDFARISGSSLAQLSR